MLFFITFQCREDFLSGKIHEFENDGQKGASRIRAILFEITYIAKQDGVFPKTIIDRLWVHFLTEYTYMKKSYHHNYDECHCLVCLYFPLPSIRKREGNVFWKEKSQWKKCFWVRCTLIIIIMAWKCFPLLRLHVRIFLPDKTYSWRHALHFK